jgi:hypothetical protein
MRLYFSDDSLKYKVTLAENGWQIYDSTLYFKNKDFFCEVKYRKDQFSYPFYSLGDTICHKSKISKKFNDELSLVRFYTIHLEYLLSLNPKSFRDSFWFSDSLRPMIFASFGIPHECLIKSFKYEMQDNLLKEDQFYFDCCRLKRKYFYKDNMLEKVEIVISGVREDDIEIVDNFYIYK